MRATSVAEPTRQFILTYTEVNALTAMLTGTLQNVETVAGRNSHAWILLNSLRTHFAEAAYGMSGETDQHPCRGCDRMRWEHPQHDCEGWY